MKSKKSHEGYLLIDHTFSPGVPEELLKANNLISAPPGKRLEAATLTCKHCQKTVIKNPERTRARGYCSGCDHFICDTCDALKSINGCQNIERILDTIQEEHGRNLNLGEI